MPATAIVIGLRTACSTPSATPSGTSARTAASAGATSNSRAGDGTGACAPVGGAATPVLEFDDAFADCLDPGRAYTATVTTSEGTVAVQLDTARTPIAANNFVNLTLSGYFDDTVLFRTEARTGIVQGGSPHTQNNRDPGPGDTIPDEGLPFSTADYAPGIIAVANSGPDSGGGQFFFLARAAGSYLGDPGAIGDSARSDVVFGRTNEGPDVLQAISDRRRAAVRRSVRSPSSR